MVVSLRFELWIVFYIGLEFQENLADALEDIYGDAVENKLLQEVEYQKDPQAYERELMMNINSENQKRQCNENAYKWGLKRKGELAC